MSSNLFDATLIIQVMNALALVFGILMLPIGFAFLTVPFSALPILGIMMLVFSIPVIVLGFSKTNNTVTPEKKSSPF
jgi:riboflavin transporter FmnP